MMKKKLFYERPNCYTMEVRTDSPLAASPGVGKDDSEDGGDDNLSKRGDWDWDAEALSNEEVWY